MSYDASAAANDGPVLRMRVAPDARHSQDVRRTILRFAESCGVDPNTLHDFITALGEAIANAVEHSRTRREIEIDVWLVDMKMYATVVDHGVGFTPGRAATRPQLPEAFSERGRGLPIMKQCTEMFSIRSTPGKGTSVILGSRCAAPEKRSGISA